METVNPIEINFNREKQNLTHTEQFLRHTWV